jgi:hypothetical protein
VISIPVLYICVAAHCEFLQQLTHYADRKQCMEAAEAKKQEYIRLGAKVDATCIDLVVQKRGSYES